jgi:type VI secretion system protein ImpA
MKRAVEPYAGKETTESDAASLESAPGGGIEASTSRRGPGVSGTIQSRADVIKALDLICDFYREHEPSSPVPLIIERAHRLVNKDFMEILTDLTPDALAQLRVITGTKPDK